MKPTALYFFTFTVLTGSLSFVSAEIRQIKNPAKSEEGASQLSVTRAAGEEKEVVDWQKIEDRLVARGGMLYTCWDVLKTRSGTYTEVEVKATSPVGITVRHRGGMDDIVYSDLSPELQLQFHYDPQEARDFLAGKDQPYLPAARQRAVEHRISVLLDKKHAEEVAALEKLYTERRLADERRVKARDAWESARETFLKLEQAFYKKKGQAALGSRVRSQQLLVARRENAFRQAQAAYDALPNPLAQ